MIEVNRKLYMDENTGAKLDSFTSMREFVEESAQSLAEIPPVWGR